jgi:hypothetical protein
VANKVSTQNEIYLNGTYFPVERPVQSVLASIYPSKVVIGDTTKDSQLRSSIIAWSDWRGGIGIERMEGGGDVNRAWDSNLQLRYKNHLVLGNLVTATDTIGHGRALFGNDATGIGTINTFDDKIYAVWNGNDSEPPRMYVYNNALDYWWDGRTEDEYIGEDGSDSFGVPDQVTDSLNFVDSSGTNYLVLAHYDSNDSGYSYATVPSYDGTNPAVWTNDTTDTKYLAQWDERLWGISHGGQLWYAHTLGTEVNDALLPLPAGYCTELFVARDSRGEPILYVATKQGLWAHDAFNARFVKTEVEFPFHPHGGKGTSRWRDSVYFPSGLGLYKYVNGSNSAVLTVVGPDRDDGLESTYRGSIMLSEGTHNELMVGVDASSAPTAKTVDEVPYQWNHNHTGSPVIDLGSGRSSIIGYNELGWEYKWRSENDGRKIDAMHVSNAYSDVNESYRLWFAHVDVVYYMKLPVDIINPSMVDEFDYATEGELITPWFNAGQSEVDKLALKLKVETSGCSSTETVTISYATDYGTGYEDFAAITSSTNITTHTFNSGVGTKFRSIRFKIALERTTSGTGAKQKTPDVISMTLEWRKKLEPKWGHQVGVSLNRDYKGKTPKQLRAALISAIESTTLVEFTFRDDNSADRNYYVDVTSATGLETTGYDERGASMIMLVEP